MLSFKFPPPLTKETDILLLKIKNVKTTFLLGSAYFRPFNHIVTFLQLLPMPEEPADMFIHLFPGRFYTKEIGI
jgi:hypothetical protein